MNENKIDCNGPCDGCIYDNSDKWYDDPCCCPVDCINYCKYEVLERQNNG